MTDVMSPLAIALDFSTGRLDSPTSSVRRCLSDMRGMYANGADERRLVEGDDPLVYEVQQYDVPNEEGQLVVCTTVLYPGKVGAEYFMTKGHYHSKRDRAEVYLGLQGHGTLILQDGDRCETVDMGPGTVAYVPPYWAHRSVNTGEGPLVFFAVYPADAGHDYATIEREGFGLRIVERDGEPVAVPA